MSEDQVQDLQSPAEDDTSALDEARNALATGLAAAKDGVTWRGLPRPDTAAPSPEVDTAPPVAAPPDHDVAEDTAVGDAPVFADRVPSAGSLLIVSPHSDRAQQTAAGLAGSGFAVRTVDMNWPGLEPLSDVNDADFIFANAYPTEGVVDFVILPTSLNSLSEAVDQGLVPAEVSRLMAEHRLRGQKGVQQLDERMTPIDSVRILKDALARKLSSRR